MSTKIERLAKMFRNYRQAYPELPEDFMDKIDEVTPYGIYVLDNKSSFYATPFNQDGIEFYEAWQDFNRQRTKRSWTKTVEDDSYVHIDPKPPKPKNKLHTQRKEAQETPMFKDWVKHPHDFSEAEDVEFEPLLLKEAKP